MQGMASRPVADKDLILENYDLDNWEPTQTFIKVLHSKVCPSVYIMACGLFMSFVNILPRLLSLWNSLWFLTTEGDKMRNSCVFFSLISTLRSTFFCRFFLSLCSTNTVIDERQTDQILQVSRKTQSEENTKQPKQPEVTVPTQTILPSLCLSSKWSIPSILRL